MTLVPTASMGRSLVQAGARLLEERVQRELAKGDVQIGGRRAWDIRVHDRSFYVRLALDPALAFGETYVEGLWDCDRIDLLFERLLEHGVAQRYEHGLTHRVRSAVARFRNRQSRARGREVAERHYDAGNDLFATMLDATMTYTCADWSDRPSTLYEAQIAKLDGICRRLDLQPGDRLLDVGCGWGGLAQHASERYGASVVGMTISREQVALARERCAHLPNVRLELLDYRDLPKLGTTFDKVASIEMIEAVGPANYQLFFEIIHAIARRGAKVFLEMFVANRSLAVCNPFFDRYVFPNGVSPSLAQLAAASEPTLGSPRWSRDMREHYPPTLLAWRENLERGWRSLAPRYSERMRRLFAFYLSSLAGVFRVGHLRLFQQLYLRP